MKAFLLLLAVHAVPTLDSGVHDNSGVSPRLAWSGEVRHPGASSLRLHLEGTRLSPGSELRIRAARDGEEQRLDARTLAMWSVSSAYFNGDEVSVELWSGPGAEGDRVVVGRLEHRRSGSFSSLCGADDRVPTELDWIGRTQPESCTAAVWNAQSCIVSAGHCFDSPMSAQVLEFRVPENDGACAEQHPPVDDQFPILDRDFENAGVGDDWAVARVGTNGLGETPYERYGLYRPISAAPALSGDPLEIAGYGIAAECNLTRTQQRSFGQVTGVLAETLEHDVDTTSGNSGSAILREEEIVAVHTHAGCPANRGTRVDDPAFATARVETCFGAGGVVAFEKPVYACSVPLWVLVSDPSLIGFGITEVEVFSDQAPTPQKVFLAESFPGVFRGAVALPLAHGETATATWAGEVATMVADCVGPSIGSVAVSAIGTSSAVVSWTTGQDATGTVHYGAQEASHPGSDTEHVVTLTDLVPCTEYTFFVSSTDSPGNVVVDDDGGAGYGFTTACPAAGGVGDGTRGTVPLRVRRSPAGEYLVLWDNACDGAESSQILYGSLSGVASHAVAGAVCGIDPADDRVFWEFPPGDLWFVVAKQVAGVEGPWGQTSDGAERGGGTPSAECGVLARNPDPTCPP